MDIFLYIMVELWSCPNEPSRFHYYRDNEQCCRNCGKPLALRAVGRDF